MYTRASTPPVDPDIKRELKKHLLSMSARSFEFFAGEFLVYVGLETVSVTRYIGDGGIDAQGNLNAGLFRIPVGIQVKRYRQNVQRPDIDKFIGALSGRFSQGMFMTTANYAPGALQKASTSIPRVLTLNGDQIVSLMVEQRLGVRASTGDIGKLYIDPDYFTAFEAMRGLLSRHMRESHQSSGADASPTGPHTGGEQAIDLTPEDDLISLNALGYALRVDPGRVRRWVEHGVLRPDAAQPAGERTSYYFRRDRLELIRASLGLQNIPASSDEWRQEFLDFARSRKLSKSYKPVMLKAFFKLADREGRVAIDDLVREFRDYYVQRARADLPVERGPSLLIDAAEASEPAIKRLIITHPLERFLIKNFMEYLPEEGTLQMAPQLWQGLRHYEVVDVLRSADEQIEYYFARGERKGGPPHR
jgi:Restriction endonuclease